MDATKPISIEPSFNNASVSAPSPGGSVPALRPRVHGKFIYVGDKKIYLRGVTYGTFAPGAAGEYEPERVDSDFAKEQRAAVKSRNVLQLIEAGGNIYYLAKLAGILGLNVQDIGAQQTGMSVAAFKQKLVAAGR